jgi:hypothetical protein
MYHPGGSRISARLVHAYGSRVTLLAGYLFVLASFLTMLLLWKQGSPYWQVGLAYALLGIGVGLFGTPASNSLTGSVPVDRVGMASGTADLQRDLGGMAGGLRAHRLEEVQVADHAAGRDALLVGLPDQCRGQRVVAVVSSVGDWDTGHNTRPATARE